MSTTTFTVTVVSTDDGNKYFIDGVRQDTLFFSKTGVYKFDQSDSSNEYHPLRLSTTFNGTHSGGSEYTTGVTTNGTPGNSGAYTQITVASDAPDSLYYYCSNHSLMGGSAFIGTSTWGNNTWNANSWQSGVALASLTGVSATASVGTVDAFPEQGWGSDSWGDENWGESSLDVTLSSAGVGTTAVGSVTVTAEINTGWGRAAWNDDAWGIQGDILLEGVQATASVGSLTVGDIIGLTGVSATVSVGAPDIIGDITQTLTGVSATASVGSIAPDDVIGLTGVSATASIAELGTSNRFGIQAYQAVDTGSNTSYSDVA